MDQWELLNRVFDIFQNYPITFLLIPIVWVITIVALQKLNVRITGVAIFLSLVVSVGITLGLVFIYAAH